MRLIDADRYRKDLLNAYDDVSMEFDVLDSQLTVNAIPIPDGATNGDMIKAVFPLEVWLQMKAREFNKSWWNAPYEGGKEE